MQLSIQPKPTSPTLQLNLGGQTVESVNGETMKLNLQTDSPGNGVLFLPVRSASKNSPVIKGKLALGPER